MFYTKKNTVPITSHTILLWCPGEAKAVIYFTGQYSAGAFSTVGMEDFQVASFYCFPG